MSILTTLYWTNNYWAGVSCLAALTTFVSIMADRRRNRRSNIDAVGFMPWTAITIMAVLATVLAAAFAIKTA
ncbi:MAG: hypothetical protein WBO17_13425 [Sphingorhabdus sp.]